MLQLQSIVCGFLGWHFFTFIYRRKSYYTFKKLTLLNFKKETGNWVIENQITHSFIEVILIGQTRTYMYGYTELYWVKVAEGTMFKDLCC